MTYRRLTEEAGDEWVRAEVIRSGGPERIHYDEQPDANFKARPIGFTADIKTTEPLIWDGDNA